VDIALLSLGGSRPENAATQGACTEYKTCCDETQQKRARARETDGHDKLKGGGGGGRGVNT
jgi:hypothetical protein